MQVPLEEENSQTLPPTVVAIARKQLVWTIVVVGGLLLANSLSLMVADWIARFRTGDEYYRLRDIVQPSCLGLIIAQLPMAWIWLRVHVISRSLRMVMGWLVSHLVLVGIFVFAIRNEPIDGDWQPLVGAALSMYLLFLMTGWFIRLFAYRCGLSHLWAVTKRHSHLSIGDLLSFTFVAAMVMGEIMVIRESIPWATPQYSILPFLMYAFVAIGAATISTLELGSVYSPKYVRFRWMFAVLVILGPTLVVGPPVFFFRVARMDTLISTNLAIWLFAATLTLLFPTLPRRT